jgi:hypothetical protein
MMKKGEIERFGFQGTQRTSYRHCIVVFSAHSKITTPIREGVHKPKLEGELLQARGDSIYSSCIRSARTAVGVQVKRPMDKQWPGALILSKIAQPVLRSCQTLTIRKQW